MPRVLSSDALAAIAAGQVYMALAVRLDFPSGFLRLNSTPLKISISGEDYLGVGELGSITGLDETTDIEAAQVQLQLSGLDSAIVASVLGETYQGRDVRIFLCLFTEAFALIDAPMIYRGRMDYPVIDVGETATITMNVANRLADWDRSRASRWTNEEQQRLYPGDLGLQYVGELVNKPLPWGVSQK
jgi:hypothetical protein